MFGSCAKISKSRIVILCACLFTAGALAAATSDSKTAKPTQASTSATDTRDYVAVVNRPRKLHLIDMHSAKVINVCDVPGEGEATSGTLVMSPDNTVAYVLANNFEDIYGIEVDTCKLVFSARQSAGNERIKSIASLAMSPDGSELYTHQNPVFLMNDHYDVQDTRIAVFKTNAGLKAKAERTFPAPRQITIMATDADNTLYMAGRDIFAMNVTTGKYHIALPSASVDDPKISPRDSLTVWPIGNVSNEFIRLYSAAEWLGEPGDMEKARLFWGYERIDLQTGEAETLEFGPVTEVFFTGMTRPGHRSQVYAVLNNLVKFDTKTKTEVQSAPLEHTYYQLNFSTDGSKVYLGGAADDIAIYDAESLKKLAVIPISGDQSMSTFQVFSRKVSGS